MAALRFDEDKVDPQFAYFYLHEKDELIASLAEGTTIQHLPRDFMEIFEIPVPPIEEQNKISQVLSNLKIVRDRTDEIQTETRRLKRGTVNRLLRSGVGDHNLTEVRIGPRKEQLPADWDLQSIGQVSLGGKEGLRGGPPGGKIKKEIRTESGYKIYVQENIIERDFKKRSDYISEEKYQSLKSVATRPGDILITTEGSIGMAAVLPDNAEKGIINNHLARLRVDTDKYVPEYIAEVIDSSDLVKAQIESLSNNSGRPGLNLKIIKEFKIPIPSKQEQDEIVGILDAYDSKIKSESKYATGISLLENGLREKLMNGELRFK